MVRSVRNVPRYGIVPCMAPWKGSNNAFLNSSHLQTDLVYRKLYQTQRLACSPYLSAAAVSSASVSDAPWHSSPDWRTSMCPPTETENPSLISVSTHTAGNLWTSPTHPHEQLSARQVIVVIGENVWELLEHLHAVSEEEQDTESVREREAWTCSQLDTSRL